MREKIELGKRLKELRGKRTIKTVHKATGVPIDYLERLEDGSKINTPSANALYKLAHYYKVELDELARLGGLIVPKEKVEVNQCPEFPFFGAKYPDARCVDGKLYDLDKCDDQGRLYEMGEYWPCPFCNTKEFVKVFSEYRDMPKKKVIELVDKLKQEYNYK